MKYLQPEPHLEQMGTPCTALWASVLVQAIGDMDSRVRSDAKAARDWVFDDSIGIGSFRWICEMLDLDYDRLQFACLSRHSRRTLLGRELYRRWLEPEVG
jgi:hypothetical protein